MDPFSQCRNKKTYFLSFSFFFLGWGEGLGLYPCDSKSRPTGCAAFPLTGWRPLRHRPLPRYIFSYGLTKLIQICWPIPLNGAQSVGPRYTLKSGIEWHLIRISPWREKGVPFIHSSYFARTAHCTTQQQANTAHRFQFTITKFSPLVTQTLYQ